MPRDGYAQHEPSAPTGSWPTTNGTFDQSSASTPFITTGTGPTSPASNDHPTTTTRPALPWTCRFGAQGARRRDQRVLSSRVADLMKHLVRHHATSFEAVQAPDAPPVTITRVIRRGRVASAAGGRQPIRRAHGLNPPPCDTHLHGRSVDPEANGLAGPAGTEPDLRRPDGHVPR
jgi:hypothetical protein